MTLSIVIPAYNEEQAIANIIERCLAARERIIAATPVDAVEIIVVSDGSVDRTPELARSYEPEVQVIAYVPNRGYGAALKTGFAASRGELVSFLDADGTCDPLNFIPMVNKLVDEGADIAIGSRMGPDSRMPKVRRLGNRIFRGIINWLGRAQISDAASGMRVIRRDRLGGIYPLPDGLHFTPAMSCRAVLDLHLKIVEISMSYEERVGRSKLRVVTDGLRFARVIGAIAITYRPLRFFAIPGLLLLLAALLYGVGLIGRYLRTGGIDDDMIYRMVGITAFGVGGLHLVLLGVLADNVVAVLKRQYRRGSAAHRLLRQVTAPGLLLPLSVLGLAAAVGADWRALVEYLSTGHITAHWSFVVFGLFMALLSIELVGFVAMNHLVSLLRAEREEAPAPLGVAGERGR